ncbi:aminoglycoside phosphotransferase [Micromonospora sp. ATCC 39149]|uniref:Aminoglycoside phosphotransferase n=1 Tax=Micromonospora carbonacea TaxID=47853 RepID=A0A7D5Y7J6_9ACTN|nr:aminoglycoside phosphotransferase family protein [Micromonospora sp. ATCC 39149]EEP71480.1 aminoglycoside phosphotransferase [Micromonospora sp. ATCC 39149]QLJ97739.1 aminoglycoside phosphotransferase [Micromonospora carbonacea]
METELEIPERLGWVGRTPAGRAWLAVLPARLAECVQRWGLRLQGPPFPYAHASLALPAKLPDGTRAVLKLQYPDADSAHEATALTCWAGDGAARLLAHDPGRRALLVERCDPGTSLHATVQDQARRAAAQDETRAGTLGGARREPLDAALDVVVGLLPRLWRPAGAPFTPLAEEAAGWLERLPVQWARLGRPFERRLLDAGLGRLAELAGTQGEQVLVNQDLHAGNILRATREPWLVIDPKPLAGEREFGVVAIVRGPELGHSPAAVRRRLDRLTDELGLDRERALGWAIGHTLAWSMAEDVVFTNQIDVARWLLDFA